MSHHKIAGLAYAAMGAVTIALGCVFAVVNSLAVSTGLYWAIITVTTIGYGDVVPHNGGARVVAVALAVTGVPLYSLTVALFTSWLMAGHLKRSEERIKSHTERRIKHHLGIEKDQEDPNAATL